MKKIPQCDQVTEVNELSDLATIENTLRVIVRLAYSSEIDSVSIATVGGVEIVVKVLATFPECQALQESGCSKALLNLACCSIGVAKAIESGEIEILLASPLQPITWALQFSVNMHAGLCEKQQGKHRATNQFGWRSCCGQRQNQVAWGFDEVRKPRLGLMSSKDLVYMSSA
jgi:hypothetical protein